MWDGTGFLKGKAERPEKEPAVRSWEASGQSLWAEPQAVLRAEVNSGTRAGGRGGS